MLGNAKTQAGAQDVCAEPKSVAAQPPQSIPTYPNAELHVGQTSGSNGFFGFCTDAQVSAIAQFYAQQLPAAGWQQLKTTTIQNVQQVTASQGSTHLIVSIMPDALTTGNVDILVEEIAQ